MYWISWLNASPSYSVRQNNQHDHVDCGRQIDKMNVSYSEYSPGYPDTVTWQHF